MLQLRNANLIKILFYFICLIPFLLVSGPFLPDFALSFVSLIFIILVIKEKKWNILNDIYVYFFLIFFIFINISAFFSIDQFQSFKSVLFYFRFVIFFVAFNYIFKKINKSGNIFFNFLFVLSLIVIFDSLLQYFFGFNILGMEQIKEKNSVLSQGHGDRVTGLFGKDEVLGSFLSKLLPILLAFYFFIKKDKINTKLVLFILTIFLLSTFISGERAAFIQILIFTSIFFILVDFNQKKKILFVFLLFASFIIISVISYDSDKKLRMIDSVYKNFKQGNIFSQYHQSHYITGYRMFVDKPILGHGPKSFRLMCNNKKYNYNEYSCSTHPHNTYIQLLSENGIIGFLPILFLFIYVCFMLAKYFLIKIFKKKNIYESHIVIILIGLFVYLWPISPNGNFFNNWLSILFFLQISTFNYFKKN